MLTPMDIHDHQFKKATFRGYNENEVDDFLDKIVVDFERLINDNERLKNQLYAVETEIEKYRGLEKTMNDTLMVAQRTADEVISAAKRNAEGIKEQTARECQQIRDQAQHEAKQTVDAANMKRDAILAEYQKLIGEKNSFLLKMRTVLESELAITNHIIETLPKVDEAEKTPPPVKSAEETAPPEKISKPKENPKPKEKPAEKPAPEKISEPEEAPEKVEDEIPSNIISMTTKPVTDETRTYKPVLTKEN